MMFYRFKLFHSFFIVVFKAKSQQGKKSQQFQRQGLSISRLTQQGFSRPIVSTPLYYSPNVKLPNLRSGLRPIEVQRVLGFFAGLVNSLYVVLLCLPVR